MGFEALLWGRPVHCFGMPFYAGWGLTQDRHPSPTRRQHGASLEALVHACLIDSVRCIDPHQHAACEIEELMQSIGLQRRLQQQASERVEAFGFTPWKQKNLRRFLAGSELRFRRSGSLPDQRTTAVAVWGRRGLPALLKCVRDRNLPLLHVDAADGGALGADRGGGVGRRRQELRVGRRPRPQAVGRADLPLLAHGADAKAVGKYNGMTPLHWAALKGHTAMVDTLLAHGADVKAVVDKDEGFTPLHYAIGHTASVDSYLTPCIREYLDTFLRGFDDGLRDGVKVSFMQSDGGLTPAERFTGYKAILSGPAGGVVGYAITTRAETTQPVIGFDMGGTSTDVSRFDATYEQVTETETAGVTVQAPQLDINTVAAGGGSRLTFRSGTFRVGPESVGSQPGPVCYRKGGVNLAVTDANLLLGRVLPEYFPKIFGDDEDEPLDAASTRSAFEAEARKINQELDLVGTGQEMSVEEVALGYVKVANEAMCRPIRQITESKGFDTASHVLAAFGGAGPQHACAIARSLGMSTVFVHRFCGILSAYGMGLADVVAETQRPFAGSYPSGGGANLPPADARAAADELARVLAEDDLGPAFMDWWTAEPGFLETARAIGDEYGPRGFFLGVGPRVRKAKSTLALGNSRGRVLWNAADRQISVRVLNPPTTQAARAPPPPPAAPRLRARRRRRLRARRPPSRARSPWVASSSALPFPPGPPAPPAASSGAYRSPRSASSPP